MGENEQLTLSKLEEVKLKAIECETVAALTLPGLIEERRLVFVSGLAILIALFKSLDIQSMGLAGGALREGVLYSMLPDFQAVDICQRTLDGFTQRYHVDIEQALRVYEVVSDIIAQVSSSWGLDEQASLHLAKAIASLHEIGLLIDYKQYHRHSGYILANTSMPGYSKAQKDIIVAIVKNHRADLVAKDFDRLGCHFEYAKLLCVVVRLGVLLSMRRKDDVLPKITVQANNEEKKSLTMQMPDPWLSLHPLMLAELVQEAAYLSKFGWELKIERV